VILDEFDTKREFFQACRRVATAIALRGTYLKLRVAAKRSISSFNLPAQSFYL
jgi:hypothetical protein